MTDNPPPWADGLKSGARIVSIVSMLLVIFPISTYLIFKRQKRTQLPLYMCIASLGLNFSSNLGTYTMDFACLYEAAGIEFFGMATVLWWLCLSYNFYLVSVKEFTSLRVLKYESRYNMFVWIYSSVITLIAIATDHLDVVRRANSYVCWIREDNRLNQWVFYYIHLLVVFAIGLLFWPRSLYRLYRVHVYREPSDKQLMIYIRQLLFIMFFCCFFVFMIAFRVLTDFVFHGPNFGMACLHMLAFCGTGSFMFIIFGISPENLRLWKLACGCEGAPRVTAEGSQTEFVGKEDPLLPTKILEGSVSYVLPRQEGLHSPGTETTTEFPEQGDDFNIATTVVTNTTACTPGTAGTAWNFTPDYTPPLLRPPIHGNQPIPHYTPSARGKVIQVRVDRDKEQEEAGGSRASSGRGSQGRRSGGGGAGPELYGLEGGGSRGGRGSRGAGAGSRGKGSGGRNVSGGGVSINNTRIVKEVEEEEDEGIPVDMESDKEEIN